ncbi:hypothetical protein Tco_0758534 [Tanacetum coccineum]
MDTELVKEYSKKAEAKIAQESSSKRAGEALKQESSKKQKMMAWDDIQAKVEADYQLAQILQAQEQEELSDAEKATLFV